ncbi:hypothetical protein [Pelagicoccus sp. SDUM812003]|uniref:hypothetical protein n=1 Tax=Pelagicoccus sp. SDUM812003 TaxID=3041267 RepID=UPI00280F3D24|nr:hypothetical protein [Pelagicoccus sp. SDUM812003]MDQ8203610.1 hypothetical protein [Pelagicoccus sp. SDUM812003]
MKNLTGLYSAIDKRLKGGTLSVRLALANQVAKANPPSKRGVAVFGTEFSGTSWVGKALAYSPDVAFYHRPNGTNDLSAQYEIEASRYLLPSDDDGFEDHNLRQAFNGRFVGLNELSADAIDLRRRGDYRVLVEEVASFLSIEWVARKWAPQVVVVTRHPCSHVRLAQNQGAAESEARQLNRILDCEALRSGILEPHLDRLSELKRPIERSAALWAIKNLVAHDAYSRNPDWVFVKYEDLCQDPIQRFKELYEELDLEWNLGAEDYLEYVSSDGCQPFVGVEPLNSKQVNRWKNEMSADDIRTIMRVVEPFGLPSYERNVLESGGVALKP